ncbi:hypothetical protein M3Y98_00504700 [Aphelenchoides besseyi]|nr:hypothetical protein M3Y98_00504700 [Aphelenchoides besseyi]KAI6207791.1 hypothetical protein M3Y96_00046300 [Aphelenchoides besseyi]
MSCAFNLLGESFANKIIRSANQHKERMPMKSMDDSKATVVASRSVLSKVWLAFQNKRSHCSCFLFESNNFVVFLDPLNVRRSSCIEIGQSTAVVSQRSGGGNTRSRINSTGTLWAACRAVVIGSTIIAAGLFMTILGYFDRDLTTTTVFNKTTGDEVLIVDASLRYKLTSFRYIGPVLMGIGTFLLIIACVIALESRDRHAQIIQEESTEYRRSKRDLITSATKSSLVDEVDRPKNQLTVSVISGIGKPRLNGQVDGKIRELFPKITDSLAYQPDRRLSMADESELPGTSSTDEFAQEITQLVDSNVETTNRSVSVSWYLYSSFLRRDIVVEIHTPTADLTPFPSTSIANPKPIEQNSTTTPLLLSTINLRKPRGPAPIADVEELPLSASCSTINTTSDRLER